MVSTAIQSFKNRAEQDQEYRLRTHIPWRRTQRLLDWANSHQCSQVPTSRPHPRMARHLRVDAQQWGGQHHQWIGRHRSSQHLSLPLILHPRRAFLRVARRSPLHLFLSRLPNHKSHVNTSHLPMKRSSCRCSLKRSACGWTVWTPRSM